MLQNIKKEIHKCNKKKIENNKRKTQNTQPKHWYGTHKLFIL